MENATENSRLLPRQFSMAAAILAATAALALRCVAESPRPVPVTYVMVCCHNADKGTKFLVNGQWDAKHQWGDYSFALDAMRQIKATGVNIVGVDFTNPSQWDQFRAHHWPMLLNVVKAAKELDMQYFLFLGNTCAHTMKYWNEKAKIVWEEFAQDPHYRRYGFGDDRPMMTIFLPGKDFAAHLARSSPDEKNWLEKFRIGTCQVNDPIVPMPTDGWGYRNMSAGSTDLARFAAPNSGVAPKEWARVDANEWRRRVKWALGAKEYAVIGTWDDTCDCIFWGVADVGDAKNPVHVNEKTKADPYIYYNIVKEEVSAATTCTTAASPGAPPALKAGEPDVLQSAVLWLDAGLYKPSTWDWEMVNGWDARGGCLMGNSLRKKARPPILRKDKDGLPYVDFGKFSSGRDLSIVPRRTDVRTAFVVAKLDADRYCHLLCDSKGYDFHRGANGEYASPEWSQKIARIWNGTNEVADIYSEFPPTGVTQVFCVETSAPCACDSLSRDRPGQFRERSGGRELREVVLFNRVLSDAERLAVTRHLIKKWNVKEVPASRTTHTDWKLIRRDIDNWHRMPTNTLDTSVNAAACILPGDTDPLVVALRRTRALLDDLSASVNLDAERAAFAGLASDAFAVFGEEPRLALFAQVMNLNRRISLKNPLLKGIDRLLFVTHEPRGFNEWRDGSHMCDQYYGFHGTQNGISRGDGLYILENPFSDKPVARSILAGKVVESGAWKGQPLDGCAIISPDIDWDGKRIAFAAVKNNSKLDKWEDGTCYHVFTCNLDGSNLRQLTSGPWNEFDPCWLPNGRIAFTSERRGGFVRCSGNRPVPSFTLHTMFDDGTDIVRLSHHETNEWHPSVNNDGMIVYTRWDYVDRGAGQAHHAWTCFPDGRDPRELNGNTRLHANTSPKMEMNVRQIPGSRKYIATATPHHGWAAGSLILIDPSVPDDGEMSAVRRVTPEQAFPENEQITWQNRHSGSYATAWPLSEKYFICTYDGNANGLYNVPMRGRRYAITLVDVFGNKTRIYSHPTISCLDPMPLMARKRPPVISHKTLEGRPADADGRRPAPIPAAEMPKTGEIGLVNVYDTRIPFPTNDAITALRVWQLFPKAKPLQQRPWLGAENRQTGRQCLGTVPVEADGSAYFTAPVGVPLFFQALRADGCAVQNMRSDTYLHPGERLVCSGCHEPKENVRRTALASLPLAMRRAPSAIKPGSDGSAPFNYRRLVQPILDAKCVSCHGEKRKPKAPDLRAGDWRKDKWGFLTSWNNLVHRTNYFVREIIEDGRKVNWEFFEPAYTTPGKNLAIGAPLRKMLDAGHHGVKLTPEERERLILWMDSNGQYIAHDHDPVAQRDGKVVKPALE